MSMLAERRRKQKWSLNPRGKLWSEDANKFGQKLMEKMGWSVGKGLGVKEDGIKEHVKVSYKNDSKGIGFEESDNQWTEHEANFTKLLSSLRGCDGTPQPELSKPKESLEKKSQNSRARVHYHKFTRNKDLTKYSEKDLANIFGKKTLKAVEKPKEFREKPDEKTLNFGVETYNSGNMFDYFKTKISNNKITPTCSDSETEATAFGFGYAATENKKKEKKTEENGLSNPAFDPTVMDEEFQKHRLDVIIEETEIEEQKTPKKKKKKRIEGIEENENIEIEPKKKKKKRKIIDEGIINPCFDDQNQIPKEKPEKKKKKKKAAEPETITETPRKRKREHENPCFDPSDSIEQHDNTNFEIKRKKKKKKHSNGIENVAMDTEMPIEDDQIMMNVISKPTPPAEKKERRKSVRFSDVNHRIYIDNTDSPANLHRAGIENAAFNDLDNQIEENANVLSNELDNFQAELENDMNYAKINVMIGEPGPPIEQNERLPTGEAKLAFKHANFGRIPIWMKNNKEKAKSSYRHLIKGDVVLNFKHTNLHEIAGYGMKQLELSS